SLRPATGPAQILATDADGRFAVVVDSDRLTIAISKPGFVLWRPSTPIDMAIAATTDGLDIRLLKAASISGRIVDPFGEPVSGVVVTVESMDGSNRAATSLGASTTDDLGEFRIGSLPAGRYIVTANARPALAALAQNAALGP